MEVTSESSESPMKFCCHTFKSKRVWKMSDEPIRFRRSKGTTGSAAVAVNAGTLLAAKPVEGGWDVISGEDAPWLTPFELCKRFTTFVFFSHTFSCRKMFFARALYEYGALVFLTPHLVFLTPPLFF